MCNITKSEKDVSGDVSEQYICYGRTKRIRLRDDELVAVCRFLGVNPMDFADESEKKGE